MADLTVHWTYLHSITQHQHAVLAFEKLTNVPEPVIALLEVLLS